MKHTLALALGAGLLLGAVPARSQGRDEARPRDLERLLEDARNLDEELLDLPAAESEAREFSERAEEIREDTIYLKVKMRRHRRASATGTGVSYDEVSELRRTIADLRDDLRRTRERDARGRDLRLPEGTRVLVRLDEPLSSATARREDRFDASVLRPVRADGQVAIPAGARVRGVVKAAEPAQRASKGGQLELDFDTLYLEPRRLDLRSRVVSLDQDDTGRDGAAGKAGIGAVLGGVLGGILGGKKGAIVGIIVGGTGAVVASKGDEVELPAGTVVTLELTYPLAIERDEPRHE
jgi:hypothetical protein